jgi:hypothetical protein
VYARSGPKGLRAPWIPRAHSVYRPVFRSLPQPMLEPALATYTHAALAAGALPLVGPVFRHLMPIQDLRRRKAHQDGYEEGGGDSAKREEIRFEWALHSAYDGLTPAYVAQFVNEDLHRWAERAGLVDIRPGSVPATVVARRPL